MSTNKTRSPARLRTRTLGDLLDAPIPVREYLLEPLIREGESMMLWAAPGVGKTMVALSIALAVAGGGRFLAWAAPKPCKVLYVDGEMHLADLQDRLRSLATTIPGFDVGAARGNLTVLARQDQDPEADFPDLATDEGQAFILDKARREEFSLVILDNFSVLADVDDENDAAAMSPVLAFLMRMKQANVATMLLHHSSKGGDNYRGSSKLATTFEVIAGLETAKGVESRHSSAFDMTFGKFRGKRNDTIEATTAWLQEGSDGALTWHHKMSDDAQLRRLVDAVGSCRFITQKDLATTLNVSTGKLSAMKTLAIGRGFIREDEWTRCMNAAKDAAQAESAGDDGNDNGEDTPF